MDMVKVVTIEKSQKMKNGPGSRRRLDKKYRGRLNVTELVILYGRSQSMDAMASAKGW